MLTETIQIYLFNAIAIKIKINSSVDTSTAKMIKKQLHHAIKNKKEQSKQRLRQVSLEHYNNKYQSFSFDKSIIHIYPLIHFKRGFQVSM